MLRGLLRYLYTYQIRSHFSRASSVDQPLGEEKYNLVDAWACPWLSLPEKVLHAKASGRMSDLFTFLVTLIFTFIYTFYLSVFSKKSSRTSTCAYAALLFVGATLNVLSILNLILYIVIQEICPLYFHLPDSL